MKNFKSRTTNSLEVKVREMSLKVSQLHKDLDVRCRETQNNVDNTIKSLNDFDKMHANMLNYVGDNPHNKNINKLLGSITPVVADWEKRLQLLRVRQNSLENERHQVNSLQKERDTLIKMLDISLVLDSNDLTDETANKMFGLMVKHGITSQDITDCLNN